MFCCALVFSQERHLCPLVWATAVAVPCVSPLQPLPCGLAWVDVIGTAPHRPSEVSHGTYSEFLPEPVACDNDCNDPCSAEDA